MSVFLYSIVRSPGWGLVGRRGEGTKRIAHMILEVSCLLMVPARHTSTRTKLPNNSPKTSRAGCDTLASILRTNSPKYMKRPTNMRNARNRHFRASPSRLSRLARAPRPIAPPSPHAYAHGYARSSTPYLTSPQLGPRSSPTERANTSTAHVRWL